MRTIIICAAPIVFFLMHPGRAATQDEARAIILKAIKSTGGTKRDLEDIKGLRTKQKGTMELKGVSFYYSQSVIVSYVTGQFKDVVELEANNVKISNVTVFNGKNSWATSNGKIVKLDDKVIADLKEAFTLMKLGRLTALLDVNNGNNLTVIGETRVEGRPAIGIRVSNGETKDFSVYFDKITGLAVKHEHQVVAFGRKTRQEKIVRSYKDQDGRKIPHVLLGLRDGKTFVESEMIEYTQLENVDPAEFEMPK